MKQLNSKNLPSLTDLLSSFKFIHLKFNKCYSVIRFQKKSVANIFLPTIILIITDHGRRIPCNEKRSHKIEASLFCHTITKEIFKKYTPTDCSIDNDQTPKENTIQWKKAKRSHNFLQLWFGYTIWQGSLVTIYPPSIASIKSDHGRKTPCNKSYTSRNLAIVIWLYDLAVILW